MMLAVLFMRMRGASQDASGEPIDLSVEAVWRRIWKEIREACPLDREGMERDERKGGDNRKWDMGMEGITEAKPVKAKAPAKEPNQETAPTKKVKFKQLSVSPKSVDRYTPCSRLCMHALGQEFGVGLGCKRHDFRGLKKVVILAAVKDCPNVGIDKEGLRKAVSRSTKF